MASTAVDVEGGARRSGSLNETPGAATEKKTPGGSGSPESTSIRSVPGDHTHRTLKSRHIQLIGETRQSVRVSLARC
jgi:amino acid transporter